MEEAGFKVARKICGLATAWSAEFVHGKDADPITIGFNSESAFIFVCPFTSNYHIKGSPGQESSSLPCKS